MKVLLAVLLIGCAVTAAAAHKLPVRVQAAILGVVKIDSVSAFAALLQEYSLGLNYRIGRESQPLLVHAAEQGAIAIAKYLLVQGAKVSIRGEYDETALSRAVTSGHAEVTEILLKYGAEVNGKHYHQEFTPLMIAAKNGHPEVLEILLKYGAEINNKSIYGDTALVEAVVFKQLEAAAVLLNNGADPNATDNHGDTALMMVPMTGQLEMAKLLLKYDADLNVTNNYFNTALMKAVGEGRSRIDLVELLLSRGAHINVKNKGGHTALDIAAAKLYNRDMEKLLRKHGAIGLALASF